jgi:hypothetical protein
MFDETPDQIDHMIEVFSQLQEMAKDLDDPLCNYELVVGLILALIRNTKVPQVTILPNIKGLALA